MGQAGRRGAIGIAGALVLAALPALAEQPARFAALREMALERLPPGARPDTERAQVRRVTATYGERLIERVLRDARGNADPSREPASSGDWLEVEYTVDPRLEARIRDALARDGVTLGHVILMDPESGDLFAYVSTDPERFPGTRAYPTASLMKIVTAAAVLQHAPDAAQRKCHSVGSPYQLVAAHLGGGGHAAAAEGRPSGGHAAAEARPSGGHAAAEARPSGGHAAAAGGRGGGHAAAEARPGDVEPGTRWIGSFRSALAISNNQCFARFAVHDVGEPRLLEEIRRAGLTEAPGFGHAPGSVDPPEEPLDLGNLGSGLAGSAISPLGAARLAGLLASGKLVTPNWIAEVRDAQGIAIGASGRGEARRAWDPATAAALRELLEGVVEVGTASRAFHRADGAPRLGPVRVAGKTGTLRGPDPAGLYQWFVGVAPAAHPRIAIVTLVVHTEPQRGTSASELAASSLEQVFCAAGSRCDDAGVEVLHARAAGRAAQVSRGRREAVAAARREEPGLDEPLRPLGDTTLRLPRPLLRDRVRGEVTLRVELDPRGRVSTIAVEDSDLPPDFGQFLVEEVRGWRFTPPRRGGYPVTATVRLPIPVQVD